MTIFTSMQMKLLVVESIEQFITIARKLQKEELTWFRGQANASHQLSPSIFRKRVDISIDEPYYKREQYLVQNQDYGLDKFRSAIQHLKDCSEWSTIDYLYCMQHYDIPTRLLDFSTNPLVALYFCVSHFIDQSNQMMAQAKTRSAEIDDFYECSGLSDQGGAIFCIRPERINILSREEKEIVDLNLYNFDSLYELDFPICIKGNSVDPRIIAQEGVFTYFGNMVHPLDWYEITERDIIKIFVPNSVKYQLKKELCEKYKIRHSTMFPDMKGVSLEIIDEMNEEFLRRISPSKLLS